MLAKEWVRWENPEDDATADLLPCLGIAPVICDTHAEGDNWEELKAALRLAGEGSMGYGIASGSILEVYPDGSLRAESGPVSCYTNHNNQITECPDRLPIDQNNKSGQGWKGKS